MHGSWERQEGV